MMLKNIMEEKQLDFNQPLLSVRRFSSTVASETYNKRKTENSLAKRPPLPAYESELKSGPVRNPGSIPFVWEQTPGRPKNENKPQIQALQRPLIAPKLPPGRVLNVKEQNSDKIPKGIAVTQSQTRNLFPNSQCVSPLDKDVNKHKNPKVATEEEESSGSDVGDETYLDAVDTLSRTDSFFMNCSVSGLSGLDDPDVKPSGSFSTDPQTRDFMMGRFLPAAKAMASEAPQYASKKPSYCTRTAKTESEDEAGDHCDGSEKYAANVCGLFPRFCLLNPIPGMRVRDRVLSSSVHGVQAKSSSSSYSETGKEHVRNTSYWQKSMDGLRAAKLHESKIEMKSESDQYKSGFEKVDGSTMISRFKGNSISASQDLNSQSVLPEDKGIQGLSKRTKNVTVNGVDAHGRGRRNHDESLPDDSNKQSGLASPVVEKTLYIDSINTVKSHSCSNSHSSEMKGQVNHRGGDYETSEQDNQIKRKPSIDSSLEDNKNLVVAGEKASLQLESSESLDSCFFSCSDRSSYDVQMEISNGSIKDKSIIQESSTLASLIRAENEMPDSKTQGSESSNEGISHALVQNPVSSPCSEVACYDKNDCQRTSNRESSGGLIEDSFPRSSENNGDMTTDLGIQQLNKSGKQGSPSNLVQDSVTLASSKVFGERKIDLESQWLMKLLNQRSSHVNYLQLPIAPPLPKSPSESWLKRTLPTISSRNTTSRSSLASYIHTRSQTSKAASFDPKWETIVKSSNVDNGHLRFSEELITIPEA
ncbi:DUF688 family protein [Quillaja saponaria]|uniref:DUF688 family protein n=1 Tax=Quillaja saponaria TaxID=32244 RepID=A0AAD7QHL0_QUISA|nr:DUF688 family protein [Quillaja saponaria]